MHTFPAQQRTSGPFLTDSDLIHEAASFHHSCHIQSNSSYLQCELQLLLLINKLVLMPTDQHTTHYAHNTAFDFKNAIVCHNCL